MFNLQGSEIIVILLLALVVLGPEKLPDAIRRFTQAYSEFRKMSSGFQSELRSALDEPMREMRETANLMRDAADPSKIVAEAEAEQRLRDEARTAPGDDAPGDDAPVTDAAEADDAPRRDADPDAAPAADAAPEADITPDTEGAAAPVGFDTNGDQPAGEPEPADGVPDTDDQTRSR